MTTREKVWRFVRMRMPVYTSTRLVAQRIGIDSRQASAILHQLLRSKRWPIEKANVGKCGQNNGTTWRTR